eukprot:841156_1
MTAAPPTMGTESRKKAAIRILEERNKVTKPWLRIFHSFNVLLVVNLVMKFVTVVKKEVLLSFQSGLKCSHHHNAPIFEIKWTMTQEPPMDNTSRRMVLNVFKNRYYKKKKK